MELSLDAQTTLNIRMKRNLHAENWLIWSGKASGEMQYKNERGLNDSEEERKGREKEYRYEYKQKRANGQENRVGIKPISRFFKEYG